MSVYPGPQQSVLRRIAAVRRRPRPATWPAPQQFGPLEVPPYLRRPEGPLEAPPATRQAGWPTLRPGTFEPPAPVVPPIEVPEGETGFAGIPRGGGPFADVEGLPPSVVGRDNPVLRQLADDVVAGRMTTAQAAEKWRAYKFTAPLMKLLGSLFQGDGPGQLR